MSVSKEIFYNLFWQNKACQNLFLLSKEEFLDTKSFVMGSDKVTVSFPRIILSNIQSNDEYTYNKIKIRTETQNIKNEDLIASTFNKYEPIVTGILETKFGKSVKKLLADFQKDPIGLVAPIVLSFFTQEPDLEKNILSLLQKYGFIGKHINSFAELEEYFEKEIVSKNLKTVLSEQNVWAFRELTKTIKEMYVNEIYKGLYTSNQVLVSSFHDIDNFQDRLKLFSTLYESEIIKPSNEDSFIECTSCPPASYKGVFQLKIDPLKLKELKCPICKNDLTFFVPYELDKTIYDIVKTKDGLLLDALINKLNSKNIKHEENKNYLNDVEIDSVYFTKDRAYVVECKMYKQETTDTKLKIKLKRHYSKLIKDIIRVQKEAQQPTDNIYPVLLVNLKNKALIIETLQELKEKNKGDLFQRGEILTITEIKL